MFEEHKYLRWAEDRIRGDKLRIVSTTLTLGSRAFSSRCEVRFFSESSFASSTYIWLQRYGMLRNTDWWHQLYTSKWPHLNRRHLPVLNSDQHRHYFDTTINPHHT